jgi:proteic killer suppression protein
MIESFRHKGLRRFFESGDTRGINAEHAERIAVILTLLQDSRTIDGVNVPLLRLHALSGRLHGFWSVTVRANWRIIFRFDDGKAHDIDLVDYH